MRTNANKFCRICWSVSKLITYLIEDVINLISLETPDVQVIVTRGLTADNVLSWFIITKETIPTLTMASEFTRLPLSSADSFATFAQELFRLPSTYHH